MSCCGLEGRPLDMDMVCAYSELLKWQRPQALPRAVCRLTCRCLSATFKPFTLWMAFNAPCASVKLTKPTPLHRVVFSSCKTLTLRMEPWGANLATQPQISATSFRAMRYVIFNALNCLTPMQWCHRQLLFITDSRLLDLSFLLTKESMRYCMSAMPETPFCQKSSSRRNRVWSKFQRHLFVCISETRESQSLMGRQKLALGVGGQWTLKGVPFIKPQPVSLGWQVLDVQAGAGGGRGWGRWGYIDQPFVA